MDVIGCNGCGDGSIIVKAGCSEVFVEFVESSAVETKLEYAIDVVEEEFVDYRLF
jgi:hypothetical protein